MFPAPFFPAKVPNYRKRDETAAPPPPPPPPPVTRMHVLAVTAPAGPPNVAQWSFDRDIVVTLDPPTYPPLSINGAGPVGMTLLAPRLLQLHYPLVVTAGTWSCPADAANIVSVDGYKLAAASGVVG